MNENGGGANKDIQRLDRMEDVIQSMITLVLEQSKAHSKRHEEFMDEINELRGMQREQRIDVMALFEGNRQMREMLQKYFEKHP